MIYVLVFFLNLLFIISKSLEVVFVSTNNPFKAGIAQIFVTFFWCATSVLGLGSMINNQDYAMGIAYALSAMIGTYAGARIGHYYLDNTKQKEIV